MPGKNGVLFVAQHLVHGFKAGLQASNALYLRQHLVLEIPERLVTLLHTHNVVSKIVGHILEIPRLDLSLLVHQPLHHTPSAPPPAPAPDIPNP